MGHGNTITDDIWIVQSCPSPVVFNFVNTGLPIHLLPVGILCTPGAVQGCLLMEYPVIYQWIRRPVHPSGLHYFSPGRPFPPTRPRLAHRGRLPRRSGSEECPHRARPRAGTVRAAGLHPPVKRGVRRQGSHGGMLGIGASCDVDVDHQHSEAAVLRDLQDVPACPADVPPIKCWSQAGNCDRVCRGDQ
jgi:hypothetical protein